MRQYLEVLKRHRWFIVEAVVVVALVAGIASSLRTPTYRATARVLLRPNDPTEQLNPLNGARGANNPDRYVAGQRSIIQSEAVATEAAKLLPPDTSVREIESRISVAQGGESDILAISATYPDPVQARDVANAVAKGYIENRRRAAVSGLERAAKDIEDKLAPLLASIGQYDAQIGDGSTLEGVTNRPQTPTPPATSPTPPGGQPARGIDAGGAATTAEALKAARYSAALQYETLFSRQQELLVDISLKRGEAEIISEARTPRSPVSPHPQRDAALGAIVGLLLGVGFTFLREQLDDRIRSAAEVERVTGLTVLAQLPLSNEVGPGNGVAAVDHPLGALTEAVRALRTSIQYASIDQPVKVVMVTSASPGEGKSLVAANLAVTFAQTDRRTVLISADLRRATLNDVFGESNKSPGLTNLVLSGSNVAPKGSNGAATPAGRLTPANVLVKTGVSNLLLLPSGPVPPNPAEIMGSRRLATVLAEFSAACDMVIIDTPPLLPVTDAAVLAARADGVVLVVAVNETRREGLLRAKAILEGTGVRILGVVVNKTTRSGSGDYYAYYGDATNHVGTSTPRWRSVFRRKTQHAPKTPAAGTGRPALTPGQPAGDTRSSRAEAK